VRYNSRVKRLLRIMLNASTALSLVLCVITVVLWVRGVRKVDCVELDTPYHVTCLVNGQSRMYLIRLALDFNVSPDRADVLPVPAPAPKWWVRFDSEVSDDSYDWCGWAGTGPEHAHQFAGFGVRTNGNPPMLNSEGPVSPAGWEVFVPTGFVVVASGVLPALTLRRIVRRRHRTARGTCESCGYDLRATPDRCPECGAVQQNQTA
jgi:hypothetical protein